MPQISRRLRELLGTVQDTKSSPVEEPAEKSRVIARNRLLLAKSPALVFLEKIPGTRSLGRPRVTLRISLFKQPREEEGAGGTLGSGRRCRLCAAALWYVGHQPIAEDDLCFGTRRQHSRSPRDTTSPISIEGDRLGDRRSLPTFQEVLVRHLYLCTTTRVLLPLGTS